MKLDELCIIQMLKDYNNAKQAHKISSLIRTIDSWQHQIDTKRRKNNESCVV